MVDSGVLGVDYARERRKSRVLKYRYMTRAWVAFKAATRRWPEKESFEVLDLGAAEGSTLLELRRLLGNRGRFVGIEASADLVASAGVLPDETELLRGDALDPPLSVADESFDLVCALAVLEHLNDPERLVAVAKRKLRKGGVFVATCPHPFWDDLAGHLGLVRDDAHLQEMDRARLMSLGRIIGPTEYTPFMSVAGGSLPYLGIPVSPALSESIDGAVQLLPRWLTQYGFVNQAIVAVKE